MHYNAGQEIASELSVNNDAAERGVKLSSDYLKCARSEDHYQNVLQVVEGDRKMVTSYRNKNKRKVIL